MKVSAVTNVRPLSEAPPTSSLYSQPSPELQDDLKRRSGHESKSSSDCADDVSPPGSPYITESHIGRSTNGSPDVSPVSDPASPLPYRSRVFASGRLSSNIPVAKKTRKFWNRPSTDSPELGSSLTHWDVYSGEPTTRENGKPPQTTPSAVKLSTEPSPGSLNGNLEALGTSTHISGGSTTGRKRIASKDMNNTPIVRPEWRGPGGRHKIVNPLLDKPLPPGKSPTFPAGSDKTQQAQKHHKRTVVSSIRSSHQSMNRPIRPNVVLNDNELDQPVTSPGLLIESSPNSIVLPAIQQSSEPPNSSLTTGDARSPLERNPSNEEMIDHPAQTLPDRPPKNSKEADSPHLQKGQEKLPQSISNAMLYDDSTGCISNQAESKLCLDPQHGHLRGPQLNQLTSTAYANTAYDSYDSPPMTPEIGSNSPAISTVSITPNSILNRKRPVPPAGLSNPKFTARKPTPSDFGASKHTPDSKRKSLPKSPPEIEATSRISSLQAKLDNLHQRRKNLQTIIHELTNVVQPTSVAYDMASRQEIKRTVESLSMELAEINRDEHDTGLKLHRALKRDDEFAAYEPTSIWIRRVTS